MLIDSFKVAVGMPTFGAMPQTINNGTEPRISITDQGADGNRLLRAQLLTAIEGLGNLGDVYISGIRERLGLSGDFAMASKPLSEREVKTVIAEAEYLSLSKKNFVTNAIVDEEWLAKCGTDDESFTSGLEMLRNEIGREFDEMKLDASALKQCTEYLKNAFARAEEAYKNLNAEARTSELRQQLAKTCLFEARHVQSVAMRAKSGVPTDELLKMLNLLGGMTALASIVQAFARSAECQANAKMLLAKAAALEAKANMAAMKARLEDSLEDLQQKIEEMKMFLQPEADDVQAEENIIETSADIIAAAIEKTVEETNKLVAGFEGRLERIQQEKRGIEV